VVLKGLSVPELAGVIERFGARPDDARLAAELADGSVLAALDFDVVEHRRLRDALLAALTLEGDRTQTVGAIAGALTAGGGVDRQQRHRRVVQAVRMLLELFRDAQVLLAGSSGGVLRHREAAAQLARVVEVGADVLIRATESTLQLQERLTTNASADLQVLAFASRLHDALSGSSLPGPRRL
jgi:hypothetical protein